MTKKKQKEITKDSVIQVNENGPKEWMGCLMQVSEPREWGVLAWVRIPHKGNAYLRLPFEQIDHIGEAVMKLKEEETDDRERESSGENKESDIRS